MKTYSVGLLNDVVSSYDKSKTTIAGRVAQKTLPAPFNTTQVLGAPLTKFIDTQTDTLATFLPGMMHLTANNRLFILMSVPVTGVTSQIAMYNFNAATGAYSYAGKIAFSIPSATVVARGFKVDDSNSSNIKIFIATTATSVTTAGLLMINKVTAASFVPAGFPTFYTAIGNDAAAVYNLQLPLEVGGLTTMTALVGLTLPSTYSDNSSINTKVYAHNGVSATHQINIFDYSSAPSLASIGTSTVTAANTTGANTTFTMAGNTLAVGDAVVITSNAPTGYTVTGAATAQLVYYVVATNFVSGSTFSLSLTPGGAIVNGSTAVGTTTFVRGLGHCTNLFTAKTANLPTLGAGTLLTNNSENFCVPSSGANSGQDCLFTSTTTNFFTGKLSDLFSVQTGTLNATTLVTGLSSTAGLTVGQTVFGSGIPAATTISIINSATSITLSSAATTSGATSLTFGAILWSSLTLVNVLGSGIDYVLPSPLFSSYDTTTNRLIYVITGIVTIVKQFVNSMIESSFGNTGNFYMEAQSHVTDPVQIQAMNSFACQQGWVFYSSPVTIGQRGIIAMDFRSDANNLYSYIVSPVVSTPGTQTLAQISSIEQMFDFTGSVVFQYRTAATYADAIFNTATSGWTTISVAESLSIPLLDYTQFRVLFNMTSTPQESSVAVTVPAQVVDITYTSVLLAEISDYWDYSYNDSSSAIPTRIGFNLRTAYASVVPKLYFRAYDVAGNLLTTADTVTNAANFQYSTDSGQTWLPLGTIPNTVGTRIRYTHTTPPGVDERVSLKET